MWWTSQQLDAVDAAVASARAGHPTTLLVTGDPGQGKSSLLREAIGRAGGFDVRFVQGERSVRDRPYAGLGQLVSLEGPPANPFQAAQLLRQSLDAADAPVLIVVDDTHWVDAETVEALAWLARRAAGDRLLIAAATRPLPAGDRARQQLLDLPRITTIALDGLAPEQSAELLRTLDPAVSDALAARLQEHTGGNPLYLRSILAEHPAAELEQAETLPAPADLAASLTGRARALSPAAAELLSAVAVLGDAWTPLPVVADLADVQDAATAAQQLADAGLLELRGTPAGPEARIAHALVRAAIEGAIPPAERQRLHAKAAGLVADPGRALVHRMHATARYDDGLADELARFAWDLHLQHRNREAGRYLRRSSRVTSDPAERERRWLDALFEAALARDIDAVEGELGEVSWAADRLRAQLVQGFALIVRKQWLPAYDLLDGIDEADLAAADPVTRYRVLTLQGWSRLVTGAPDERTLPPLEQARDLAADPGFTGYLTFALAMARRTAASEEPAGPLSPRQQLYASAWHGMAGALTGDTDGAVRDLEAFTARIDSGQVDMGDGVFHALLGLSLWLRGDWRRAAIAFDIAQAARFGGTHPMVQAVLPLAALVAGDRDRAQELMEASRTALRAAPWPQAIVAATIADTFTLALAGSTEDRRGYRSRVFRDFGTTDLPGTVAPLWLLHAGVAAFWAGDLAALDELTGRLRGAPQPWTAAGSSWLAGLAAQLRGEGRAAAEHLRAARTAWPDSLRLHRHLLVTQLAAASTDAREAGALRDEAAAILRRVGGAGLLPDEVDPLAQLSDREKDVVALAAEGLSYAQIAKELYLSRSTVAFHLSNAYGKTGTTSRHELVQLLRRTAGHN